MAVPVIIYIMGVSGSGKTTIGRELSAKTGIPFFDADDFHPPANKEKMEGGVPLTDEDRQGWLLAINKTAREQLKIKGALIACSALKAKYREILSEGIKEHVRWIFLHGSFDLIMERMKNRKDHFMPAKLLQSQFDILEFPSDAIVADIDHSPDQILTLLLARLPL